MNIEYFKSFVETANQKSISKASEKLNLTHPALSKQIRKVEEYFEVSLFIRSSSGVELTEEGKMLYGRIQHILDELSVLQVDFKKMNQSHSYTVGTLPSLAAYYLPTRILRLEEKKIQIETVVRNTSLEVMELLQKGEIDAAVIEQASLHTTYWNKELFQEPFFMVLPKTHTLAQAESISLENINQENLVLYPPNCSVRKKITDILHAKGLVPNVRTEVDFGDFLFGYVAAGAGLTIVPEISAHHLGHSMLTSIPLINAKAKRTISLISQSDIIGKFLFKNLI